MEKATVNESKIYEIFSDELRNNKKSLLKKNNKNDIPTIVFSRVEESIEIPNNINKNINNIRFNNQLEENILTKKLNNSKEQQLKNLQKTVLRINKVENYGLKLNNQNVVTKIHNNRLMFENPNPLDSKVSVNSYYAEFLKKIKDDYRSDSEKEENKKSKIVNSNIVKKIDKKIKEDKEDPYENLKKTLIVKGNVLQNIIKQCVEETKKEKMNNLRKSEKIQKKEKNIEKTEKNYSKTNSQHKKKSKTRKIIGKVNDKDLLTKKEKKSSLVFENESDDENKKQSKKNLMNNILNNSLKTCGGGSFIKPEEEIEKAKKRRKKSKCFRSLIFKGIEEIFPEGKDKIIHKSKENNLKKRMVATKFNTKSKELIKNKIINNSDIKDSDDNIHKRNKNNGNIKTIKNIERNSVDFDNNENNHSHKKHKNKKENEKNSIDTDLNKEKRNSSSDLVLSSNSEFEKENNNRKSDKTDGNINIIPLHKNSSEYNLISVKNKSQKHKQEKNKKSNKNFSNNSIKLNRNSINTMHFIKNNFNNISKNNINTKNDKNIIKNDSIETYKVKKVSSFYINTSKNVNISSNNNFVSQPYKFNIIKPENLITFEFNPTKRISGNTKEEISKKESEKKCPIYKDFNSCDSHVKRKRKIFCCL